MLQLGSFLTRLAKRSKKELSRFSQNRPIEVLIVGFSVTGIAEGFALKLIETNGPDSPVHYDLCGIGGITPTTLPFLLPRILRGRRPDVVMLEIGTSAHRHEMEAPWEEILPVVTMVEQVQRVGALPILLSLFRGGIDYTQDSYLSVCDAAARNLGALHCNLALPMHNERPEDGGYVYNMDGIHPTPETAAFYAEKIHAYLIERLDVIRKRRVTPRTDIAKNYVAEFLADGRSVDTTYAYDRYGFRASAVPVAANETMPLRRASDGFLHGVAYLCGPRTGILKLEGAGVEIQTYDQFCYYERFSTWFSRTPLAGQDLTLVQASEMPEIELLKGEKNEEPRVGYPIAVLTTRRPLPTLGAVAVKALDGN